MNGKFIYETFITFISTIQLYHYQSLLYDNYNHHKISDDFLDDFKKAFDLFNEAYQGNFEVFKFDKVEIMHAAINKTNGSKVLSYFIDQVQLMRDIVKDHEHLQARIDDILQIMYKYKYLYNFKK